MTSFDPDLLPEPLPPERRGWRTADLSRAAIVALAVWFGLQLLWSVSSLVFLVFLATLFGLAVARGVDFFERFKIRRGIASALIVFLTIGAIGGGLALSAPTLIESGKELKTEFPAALTKLQNWVDSKGTGMLGQFIKTAAAPSAKPSVTSVTSEDGGTALIVSAPVAITPQAPPAASRRERERQAAIADSLARPSEQLKTRILDQLSKASRHVFSALSSTVTVAASLVLLIFLAIYIGAEPHVYRGWILACVPATSRSHVRAVLAEISKQLRKWLVTQLVAMIVIGVVSTVVLLVLGVKAPYALGFLAGLLEFIPTVGPIMGAVPAIIMGFTDSPSLAFKVMLAYWAIQFIENNLLIPALMRGELDLPPAITLVAQALMTILFGFIGLMVAVPLTAAVLVPLRMLTERENARERAMVMFSRMKDETPTDDVNDEGSELTIGKADRGPLKPPSVDRKKVKKQQEDIKDEAEDEKEHEAGNAMLIAGESPSESKT